MCGRYAVYSGFDHPNYNASPGQFLPVVLQSDHKVQMQLMRWGLIPSWSKDAKYSQINARAESVSEKPTFKKLLLSRRCLIPANGFYEWGMRNLQKWPFYFHLKNVSLFSFAGLYSLWDSPDGSPIPTYTIITTQANDLVKPIHHRMPVIIPPQKESTWLNNQVPVNTLNSLMVPYPSDLMNCHPVSLEVNSSSVNTPSLITPLKS